jgi:hypothetical protein
VLQRLQFPHIIRQCHTGVIFHYLVLRRQLGGTQSSLPICIFTGWTPQVWITAALQTPAVRVFSRTPKEASSSECEAFPDIVGDALTSPIQASKAIMALGSVTTLRRKPSPKVHSHSPFAVLSHSDMPRIFLITISLQWACSGSCNDILPWHSQLDPTPWTRLTPLSYYHAGPLLSQIPPEEMMPPLYRMVGYYSPLRCGSHKRCNSIGLRNEFARCRHRVMKTTQITNSP